MDRTLDGVGGFVLGELRGYLRSSHDERLRIVSNQVK